MPLNPFEDARLLYVRAQTHISEFHTNVRNVWRIYRNGPNCELSLNRQVLKELKPVAADIANNLVHALDQVIASYARMGGHGRSRDLYYPVYASDTDFPKRLARLSRFFDASFAGIVEQVREMYASHLPHLRTLKELSNSSKHWELVPANFHAHAIAYQLPGSRQQVIEQIPIDYFEQHERFLFMVAVETPSDLPFEIATGVRFKGLISNASCDPSTVFSVGTRFVLEVIERAEKLIASRA